MKKKEGNSQTWLVQPATKVNKRTHCCEEKMIKPHAEIRLTKTTVSEQGEEWKKTTVCATEEGHPS